tara:strand:+ start:201 stop:380 length:180 start_codon:yes stop_codon:yes gene_type:complete
MKDKEYTSVVKLEFGCNNFEANSKKEYIEKVRNSFKEEFNIHLTNKEITEIERLDENNK